MSRFYEALARTLEEQSQSPPAPVVTTPVREAARYRQARRPRPRHERPVEQEYERLIQRIEGLPENQQPRVILVTSTAPQEGASTVARNIAASMSQRPGVSVLLMDANLRTPSQHTAFGITRAGGLSDVVAGRMPPDLGVRRGVEAGLSLMTCGSTTQNPPQLLNLPSLRETVNTLRRHFDWLIVDAPPVTMYPDATTLARACDGVVLVLKAESTRWEVAEQAKRLIEESGGRLFGAVLNERRYHIPDFLYKRL